MGDLLLLVASSRSALSLSSPVVFIIAHLQEKSSRQNAQIIATQIMQPTNTRQTRVVPPQHDAAKKRGGLLPFPPTNPELSSVAAAQLVPNFASLAVGGGAVHVIPAPGADVVSFDDVHCKYLLSLSDCSIAQVVRVVKSFFYFFSCGLSNKPSPCFSS